jgi:biotin carboxylase
MNEGQNMKERIMILGAGVMQGPALKIAKELGFSTVAVDADPNAPAVSLADRFEKVDLKDKERIEALGRSLLADTDGGGLAGILTAGTDFSASVAWAAEKLGLPGIPYEAALNASDKERMRRCFKAAGIPSPEFTILSKVPPASEKDFLPFALPAVVKPVDNMGGRGCRRIDTREELGEAVADALRFSRSGRAIVEAFMEGPEFSVDAIVYHGEITICGLADRHIFFPPYFIEMGHTMPTNVSHEQQKALLAAFTAAARSLGIAGENCCGAAKGDIKLTPNGPMIGEVAARLSGGYMSGWTYPYASGVEPTRAAILIAAGRKPGELLPLRSWTCAERAFISIPGKVRSILGLDKAKAVPGVKDLFLRAEAGKAVTFPENNVSKCGNIIASAPVCAEAATAAESAARSILIRLQSPDPETAAFLAGSGPFPPDAFALSAELRSALEKLPDPEKLPAPPSMPLAPVGGAAQNGEQPVAILAFPSFIASNLRDYTGRSIEESLEAVRLITGLPLPIKESDAVGAVAAGDNIRLLGRSFWSALIRGGYQGAVYIVDEVNRKRE